jgi:hypothetical protein
MPFIYLFGSRHKCDWVIVEAAKTGRCSLLKDPYRGLLLEKLIVIQVVKKCPALYGN